MYGDHTFNDLYPINSFYREQLLSSGYQNDLKQVPFGHLSWR